MSAMNLVRGHFKIVSWKKTLNREFRAYLGLLITINTNKTVCPKAVHTGTLCMRESDRIKALSLFNTSSCLLKSPLRQLPWPNVSWRAKSTKKKRSKRSLDDTDEEDEFSDEDSGDEKPEKGKDFKDLNLIVSSPRVDTLIQKVFNMSQRKVEETFYAGKIRLNGKKVLKKSLHVKNDDELDVVKGVCQHNDKMLEIMRIVISSIKARPEEEDYKVKVRRFKDLIVYDYDNPWDKTSE